MKEKKEKFPKELIEWAAWAHLDKEKNIELLLLKGHLFLDSILKSVLEDERLSFYGKAKKYMKKGGDMRVGNFLFQINNLRNELAHNYKFKEAESDLSNWAEQILDEFEPMYFTRKTYRTRIVHAFSVLSKEISIFSKSIG